MKNKRKDLVAFVLIVASVIVLNIIGSLEFFRLDLTSEKRYSLSDVTIDLIEEIPEIVLVRVYLDGDFPGGFQRLQRETKQMLDEFRAYNTKIQYEFIDPSTIGDEKQVQDLYEQLQYKGLKPYQLQSSEGGSQKLLTIFPGAIASYGDSEVAIPLLVDQFASSPENQVNSSVQNLEYALANGVKRLTTIRKPQVGFVLGHDELDTRYIASFARDLSENYNIDRINLKEFRTQEGESSISINDQISRMSRFDALIVAKPEKSFTDLDKFLLDQYLMNGGDVLWLIDAVHAEMDSLSKASQFLAYSNSQMLRLDDMLFKYGARVNGNLVQDLVCAGVSDQKSVNPWIYFPLVMPQVDHPITKSLNAIQLQFASSIDTIIAPGIKKTFLLRSSPYTKTVAVPHMVSLQRLYDKPDENQFRQASVPMSVLLEGEFESAFKNRILPKDQDGETVSFREKSKGAKMVIVADGDIIRNQLNLVNPSLQRGTPLPLGFDQFTGQQYGNQDFLLNVMDYMLDDSGLIAIRSRDLKIRLLDYQLVKSERLLWQIVNTVLPIGSVLLFGLFFTYWRKRKYT